MRIKEVRLTRFRQFKDTTFHFGDVNVLAGANNSGKTSVLWAIKIFYYFAKKALAVRNNQIDFHKHYVHAKDFMPIPKKRTSGTFVQSVQQKGALYKKVGPAQIEG